MKENTTRLQQLHQQVIRKKHLNDRMEQLCDQQCDLIGKVEIMKDALLAEQDDVACLEGRSLARYFYLVVGKLDEKLDKERVEAYAAQVRYDAAVRELTAVNDDLHQIQMELEALEGCEEAFSKLFQEKEAEIRKKGISDIAELQQLDAAQECIEQLQLQLRRFKTELADVTIHTNMNINVDGFLQFADFFFDGLFADWAVLDHIGRSVKQVRNTKNQLHITLTRLEELQQKTQQEWRRQVEKKEAWVVESDT